MPPDVDGPDMDRQSRRWFLTVAGTSLVALAGCGGPGEEEDDGEDGDEENGEDNGDDEANDDGEDEEEEQLGGDASADRATVR